jgi:hypothetical protein
VGSASAVSVADWNGDGRLDLIVGNRTGKVSLLLGLGNKDGAPAFEFPHPFALDEAEPVPVAGDAGPLVVDWDGDGIDDLLVGYAWGPVVFYKGVVENGVHGVLAGKVLLQPCYEDEPETLALNKVTGKLDPVVGRSHKLPKLAVFDWNGDGKLDLIVGDEFGAIGEAPPLDGQQFLRLQDLRRQQSEVAQLLSFARRPLRERAEGEFGPREKFAGGPGEWQDAVDERTQELVSRDEACRMLASKLDGIELQIKPFDAPCARHGYVWVYLRRGANK